MDDNRWTGGSVCHGSHDHWVKRWRRGGTRLEEGGGTAEKTEKRNKRNKRKGILKVVSPSSSP